MVIVGAGVWSELTGIDHSPVVGCFIGPVLTSICAFVEGAEASVDVVVGACHYSCSGREAIDDESRHDD